MSKKCANSEQVLFYLPFSRHPKHESAWNVSQPIKKKKLKKRKKRDIEVLLLQFFKYSNGYMIQMWECKFKFLKESKELELYSLYPEEFISLTTNLFECSW